MNKKYLILILCFLVIFTGCGKTKEENEKQNGYELNYNDTSLELGEKFSTKKYGKDYEYSEVKSNHFDGLDKIYKYKHYQITTYRKDKKDLIYSIVLLDDNIKTNEGLKISDSYQDMINLYGDNYNKDDDLYKYILGDTNIVIKIKDKVIVGIEYLYTMGL